MIYTLQEYMARTEGITYLLIPLFLVGFVLFWRFLNGREDEKTGDHHFHPDAHSDEHHEHYKGHY
ncbi:sulfate respiration complex protein HmcD [Desulforegula conservatrix]|uniref:sulfate respiration complex protein HmcD n=1 Tax=Desulforegula conservatrix TaxID=153026 RepID=UPI0004082B2A